MGVIKEFRDENTTDVNGKRFKDFNQDISDMRVNKNFFKEEE